MGYSLNSFPLVLSVKTDGTLETTVRSAEQFLGGAAKRAGDSWEAAGRRADKSFTLDGARREVQQFAREIDSFRNRQAQKKTDLFGIQDSLSKLSADPFNRIANEMLAAENRLAAQRARAHAENMAALSQEAQAGIAAINQRQAAQTAAFKQAESEGLRLIALDQQRIAESAKMVAGPQFISTPSFNPAAFSAAAAAAEKFAVEQRQLATAANLAASTAEGATAEQRALALSMDRAAQSAENEATRLRSLANAQQSMADAAVKAGIQLSTSMDGVTTSVRGQRFATVQASQQLQDFFIQVQGGQNPLIAFTQQASQLAFVMQGAGGATSKFANFIAGGWGTAIFAGLTVLSLFTSELFNNKKAADEAEKAHKKFQDRQAEIKSFIDETTGALIEQNKTLILNATLARQAQIASNEATIAESRNDAFKAARNTLDKNAPYVQNSAGAPVMQRNTDPAVERVIREAAGNVDKLASGLAALAKARPDLASVALQVSTIGGEAITATRENERLNRELRALGGDRNAIWSASDQEGAIAAAAATDRYSKKIAELREQRRQLRQSVDNKTFKGDRDDYVEQAAAIDRQIAAQQKAQSDAKKAESASRAAGRRAAADRREELFADAKAIADGTEAIKAANSGYQAQIVRLKNQLAAGLISPEAAKEAAIAARQIRNAAVDTAQAQKKLGEALEGDFQRFDGESSFIDGIQKARDHLAQLRAELEKPENLGGLQIGDRIFTDEDANRLGGNLDRALVKPITDANKQLREQAQIDALILAGREDEAEILQSRFQLLSQYGDLSAEELKNLEAELGINRDLILAEQQRTREIERRNQLISIQVQQARELQDAFTKFLEDPFKKDGLKELSAGISQSRRRAIAQELSVKLFGDLGTEVEDRLRRGGDAVREAGEGLTKTSDVIVKAAQESNTSHQTAAKALTDSATALKEAASSLRGAANSSGPSLGQLTTTPTSFGAAGTSPEDVADIVVTAQRYTTPGGAKTGLEPYLKNFSKDLKPIAVNLGTVSKSPLFQSTIDRFQLPLSYLASAVGGKPGQAINSFLNISSFNKLGDQIAKQVGGKLGGALGGITSGIGYGMFASDVVKMLGIKGSTTGGAIGGAIGSMVGGPIGSLIGGALGSIVGGLLKKTPYGNASFTTSGGQLGVGNIKGNGASNRKAAGGAAEAVTEGLNRILEEFGGTISGDPGVTIGTYKGSYRVSTTGHTGKLDHSGVSAIGLHSFGKDGAEAAVKFAIQAILEKGVVEGIRASTKRLLAAGKDLDSAIEKATAFENVFVELKSYTDPVGAAIDGVDKQFKRLRSIFEEAGASAEEYAQLEQLYGIKRAEAIESATKDMFSTLQGFLDSLRFSGDTGLSLRTREANARAAFAPLAATITAGGVVDQDKFTETAQSYLDIARELYGSTQQYFNLLGQVTNLTAQAITNAGGTVTPITAATTATSIATATGATTAASGSATVAGITGTTAGSFNSVVAQIANDNAVLSQTIVAQFADLKAATAIPTDRLAWFSRGDVVDAVRQATTGITVSMPDVVAGLQQQTQALSAKFDTLIAVTSSAPLPAPQQSTPTPVTRKVFGSILLRNG